MGRDERVSLDQINAATEGASVSPFAKFFKGDGEKKDGEKAKE